MELVRCRFCQKQNRAFNDRCSKCGKVDWLRPRPGWTPPQSEPADAAAAAPEASAPFCVSCGTKFPDPSFKFCVSCGTPRAG